MKTKIITQMRRMKASTEEVTKMINLASYTTPPLTRVMYDTLPLVITRTLGDLGSTVDTGGSVTVLPLVVMLECTVTPLLPVVMEECTVTPSFLAS